MKALSHMKFDSLLDVGGAEGYTAYIARQIFGVKVRTSDLCEEACMRAREIFHIDSDPADIHELPYEDNKFDVVLCSATLEHVTDYQKAISELLRVAGRAVVITLPHEDRAVIEKNVEKQLPHAHIHNFTLDSSP
jgi:ubiquinone/menaquinone biosynthesis C-methylase UbiE